MTTYEWPPEYTQYEGYEDSDLCKVLELESVNTKAPESYRKVLSKIISEVNQLSENSKKDQAAKNKALVKCDQYGEYVKAAEKNYEYLAELYKAEHKTNLDQQEKILQLELKIKEMEEKLTLGEQRLQQQVKQLETVHSDRLARQKEEYTRTAHKQAMGRKNIEEKLIVKDNELTDIKKKLQNMESRLIQIENQRVEKVKETEHFKNENAQLKLLLTYLQPQQPAAPQQHIQQHF